MAQESMKHHDSNNAHTEDGKSHPPLRRSAFRALVQDFGPLWFTWCMNSGVLGLLTHQCPYQFPGLRIISNIFYVFDLTLFVVFSTIFLLRFAIFRLDAYNEVATSRSDLPLCGCWPIAFLTLTSLTPLICSNAYWGGHAFTILGYVMWWIAAAWSLAVLLWVFITYIRRQEAKDIRLPTMVIIPAVSVSTVAVTGAIVVTLSYDVSPRLAIPVIIVSFMMVGLGILLGLMLSTYLFHQLLAQGWPPAAQTASVFILIGPMGQSAAALQQLGSAARTYGKFAGYNEGTFLTAEAAAPLDVACTLVALLLTGLGIVWTLLSIWVMVERAFKKELSWNPGWSAIIFPTGTLVTNFSFLAIAMDSPAFRVITAAMIIILVVVFLMNLAFTLTWITQGKLLIVREDPRVKKMMEEQQKEQ